MNLERITRAHPRDDCRRIDIMVGAKELWGRGYGTDAIRTLVEFGFEKQAADLILGCDIDADNSRSIAAFRKAGFREYVDAESSSSASGGTVDVVITRTGWKRREG